MKHSAPSSRIVYGKSWPHKAKIILPCRHTPSFSFPGNVNGRFRMDGNKLLPNTLSFDQTHVLDPPIFELLVQVADSSGTPRFSTTVTIIVFVVSCSTIMPTTTTTTTTVTQHTIGTRGQLSSLGGPHLALHTFLIQHFH